MYWRTYWAINRDGDSRANLERSGRGWTRRLEARTSASASLAIALGDTLGAAPIAAPSADLKACAREGSLSI